MVSKLFKDFIKSEQSGGTILLIATLLSLALSNTLIGNSYVAFWHTEFGGHQIVEWINDGLMSLFFLLIGLELERELYSGELSSFKNAILPVIGAIGGVLLPALIYFGLTKGTLADDGIGIPMATDIAFAVGILGILGSKVPTPLKVFLTALAVMDDLLAILVIAFFYSSDISLMYLFGALFIWLLLFLCNRMKWQYDLIYIIGGIALWYCMLQSGVHPTLAGVILAFALPFGNGSSTSISYRWQHRLHLPVAFIVLPIFALANTAIPLPNGIVQHMFNPEAKGIIAGLTLGKPLGIALFCMVATKLRWATWPDGIGWKQILGVGFLGGIGFTMSIFITLMAFTDQNMIDVSKVAIMLASLISAIVGLIYLSVVLPAKKK